MREVNIGTQNYTKVVCLDEPGEGGACHEYEIRQELDPMQVSPWFQRIGFQIGPIKESTPNGIFMEDLLAICIDRLQHFQAGDYACRENALALTKIQEAMHWLHHRTEDRQRRGVEGTSQK